MHMPAQPIPVSMHHGIERDILFKDPTVTPEEKLRQANGFGLHYHEGGDGAPAGAWALLEWTPRGWQICDSGALNTLSPTTSPRWKNTDGTLVRGDTLNFIGLVS